ncbi:MAG: VTT domain-containing protein [Fimbriimonadaceae bacterium]
MEFLQQGIEFLMTMDQKLNMVVQTYGAWSYGLLWLIVFLETGVVVMPFLPGDSLLFVSGMLAHPENDGLNLAVLFPIFISAAFVGDNVNYFVGRQFGRRLFRNPNAKVLNPKNLAQTHDFMERHGWKAILIARFVPLMRTLVPFTAGMGTMTYRRYLFFSALSACLWVTTCMVPGYLFGKIPIIRDNFAVAILTLIGLTMSPYLIAGLRKILSMSRARVRRAPPTNFAAAPAEESAVTETPNS